MQFETYDDLLKIFLILFCILLLSEPFSEYYWKYFGEYHFLIIIMSISSSSALNITMSTVPDNTFSNFLFVDMKVFSKNLKLTGRTM